MTNPFSPTPGPGQPGVPPRSTPIPGQGPSLPPGAQIPGGQMPGPLPPGAFGQNPFGPGGPMVPGQGEFPAPRKSRSGLGVVWVLVVLIVLASVGLGVFITIKARDKANNTADQIIDNINNPGRTSVASKSPADSAALWEQASFPQALDDAIAGAPTEFVVLTIYPEYAVAQARDPVERQHVDLYDFRRGKIDLRTPQPNQNDLEGKTFTLGDVPWAKIPALVTEATARLTVEDPQTTYLIIDKGTFGDPALTIRVYVSGPRNSGYVQADENATIVTVYNS